MTDAPRIAVIWPIAARLSRIVFGRLHGGSSGARLSGVNWLRAQGGDSAAGPAVRGLVFDRVEKIKSRSVLITFNLQLTSALNYGARPRFFILFSYCQRKRRPK